MNHTENEILNGEFEILNQFNADEGLHFDNTAGNGTVPPESAPNLPQKNTPTPMTAQAPSFPTTESPLGAVKPKKKWRAVVFGTLAVAVAAVTITAVTLSLNNPNNYDKGESKFVTDSDSLDIHTFSDNVMGTGVMYESTTVYDSALSGAKAVNTLSGGTDVLIYGVSGNYYKVSNSQKTIEGYVHKDSVNTGGIAIGAPSNLPDNSDETTATQKDNTAATKQNTANVKPEDFPVNSSPYFIYVEKGSHTITIFTKDSNGKYTVPAATYSTATGRTTTLTPAGNFSILAHEAWHTWGSTSYSPYCSKYSGSLYFHGPIYNTKGDFNSLNEGSVYDIGKNTTSGCMRTSVAAAYAIYNCPVGTNVKIVNGSPLGRSASRPSVASQYIDPLQKAVAVRGISFDFSSVTIKVDESVAAIVLFEPGNATNKKCTWSISDSKIAVKEESENGDTCKFIGKKAGKATVTAVSEDGKYKAQFILIVKAAETTAATTKATTPTTEAPTDAPEETTTTTATTAETPSAQPSTEENTDKDKEAEAEKLSQPSETDASNE